MKKTSLIFGLLSATLVTITSCNKDSFGDYYRNPGKVAESSVEKHFSGVIYDFRALILPSYGNLFVTLRPTINRYVQNLGWINEPNQLVPGLAAIEERWTKYYNGLAQYKELERLYNNLSPEEKVEKRIFYLTAKILFYDQTQQTVDLHGDIPWSEAGKLNGNGGNYAISYPKYDKAVDIYTTMLDDLKAISDELNNLTVPSTIASSFRGQDLVNNGDLLLWRKYCNSLRLRMLTRVSASSEFSTRATSELAQLINNQATYPLILQNSENAQLDVFNVSSDIKTEDIRGAFEADGWFANLASKAMIDDMNQNADPRLPFLFEPGSAANGVFKGLDQSLAANAQTDLARGNTISIYNRSTISRNFYIPGILISASQVNYLLAEYYNKNGNASAATQSFENGIRQSVAQYVAIRSKSADNTVAAPSAPSEVAINAFIANLNFSNSANKLQLIARQKWLHFNLLQAVESWSEVRRLDYPVFVAPVQNADLQKTIPAKFTLPSSEVTFNSANYEAAKEQDNANVKLFWDVN